MALGLVALGMVFAYWKVVVPLLIVGTVAGLWLWRKDALKKEAAADQLRIANEKKAAEDSAREVGWHLSNGWWRYWDGLRWSVGTDMPATAEPHWQYESMRIKRWWDGARWTGHTIRSDSRKRKAPDGPEPDIGRFAGWYDTAEGRRFWNGDEWASPGL